ncbi:SusD/RagB family nutrient-binding outer membrane lipoprotein [Pricia sp. S334]|uniref:SusD/RagB family nutrient-binding outer membrane lipoprotein n=1 Tax=Pricia mediterranea TaxID=3076079 RepID=A0ABU3L1E0_9FLAO|nr:SusD/RagB family nutrient-binding outer membrane lipoprotein [Pricia sp. S334]MDT7827093.1 SusD/RagB family nutrient-binding outer membrane lipoprotein [Pricia sp. S334]
MTSLRYKLLFTVILLSLSFGCDDYLGENVDPNKELPANVTAPDLLPSAIVNTSSAHYSIAFSMCLYSQQLASYFEPGADTHEEVQLSGGWESIFLEAFSQLDQIASIAEETGDNAYLGIAKVLQAQNLGLATDQWGAVPFSTATLGEEDFTPSFDSQETVYTEINTLLDDAISLLGQASGGIGQEDLIFGGDISKWQKTAHFLKAKYALHLSEVDQDAAVNGVLANVANGFGSNEDDFQLVYNTRNFNPWHAGVVLPNATGNASVLLSDQLVSTMNGTAFPFTTIDLDPRLPRITTVGEDATEYRGGINGSAGVHRFATDQGADSVNISANTDFGADNFYSSQTAPIILGSYAEQKFMEAEALFLQNGGNATSVGTTQAAYDAYLEGIRANMEKLGVAAGESAAYLAEASVDVGAPNLTLKLIMREKNIAIFLNPESFVDLRRYDFSTDVFEGLELPVNHNPLLNGQWVRRAQYPASEQTRNGAEVEKVTQDIGTGVWWDRD